MSAQLLMFRVQEFIFHEPPRRAIAELRCPHCPAMLAIADFREHVSECQRAGTRCRFCLQPMNPEAPSCCGKRGGFLPCEPMRGGTA